MDPKQRLTRLVDLARQDGLAARRALVGEIANLLLDWPVNYPAGMREPFEVLLERALRDVDCDTRTQLADRLVSGNAAPLAILNLLVFDAALPTRAAIVARNAGAQTGAIDAVLNEAALLSAARSASLSDLAYALAVPFRIPGDIAVRILADTSGFSLAILCKGASVSRATFSALALIAAPYATLERSYERLAAYDRVQADGARVLLASWRGQEHDMSSKAA